jgi:hypothetical protein
MTDSSNNQPASKTPTQIACHVRNREGGKGSLEAHRYSTGPISVLILICKVELSQQYSMFCDRQRNC